MLPRKRCDAYGSLQSQKAFGIGGRLRNIQLEVSGRGDAGRAKVIVPSRIEGRLRKAEIETAKNRSDRRGRPPPATERALRQSAVHKDQRNAALRTHHDQIRPQIGLGEEREIGFPVTEEARHEQRRIERNELVDDPGGKRCSASFAELTVPEVTSTLKPFAAMRSTRGLIAVSSPTLAPCTQTSGPGGRATLLSPRRSEMRGGMFLAALEAMREQQVHQRRRRDGHVTIGVQRQR